MVAIPAALALALEHHQAGRLREAEQIYQQILAVDPEHADALHLLGVTAHQRGQHEQAVDYIGRAIAVHPHTAAPHYNLGLAQQALQQWDAAVTCYREAVRLDPAAVDPWNHLALALKKQGKMDEALSCFRRVLELKPDDASTHYNLGCALTLQGRPAEAVDSYRRAVQCNPGFAKAHNNMGNSLKKQGKLKEAETCYRRALEIESDYAETHSNLGSVLHEQGKFEQAVVCFRRALDLVPDQVEAQNHLGNVLKDLGKFDEAEACYRRALTVKPDCAVTHGNLGNVLRDQGKPDEALIWLGRAWGLDPDCVATLSNLGSAVRDSGHLAEAVAYYRRALVLDPDFAAAHNNLGNALKDQGKLDEALACFRRALELKPDYAKAHSNLLVTLQYCPSITPGELALAHADWDKAHVTPLGIVQRPHPNQRDSQRRLRLGFVSADFVRHPVGYFLVRSMEFLRGKSCEIVCYSGRPQKDQITARFQAAATTWRDVYALSDELLAEQIRKDRIDILFDLAGHTKGCRLLTFAHRPAPIQISWIGYEGTTGSSAMDYLLADRFLIPAETEPHCREKVLRMPDGYICYEPPAVAPTVGPLPALESGHVTFGCFNNPTKITPPVIAVWAEILHRLPRSRLVLKYQGLDDDPTKRRYVELFAECGIGPERLELLGKSVYAEFLKAYQRLDIALDPFPFSGGVTTCEALWMGVPVITSPGETFASRHGLSYLSTIGVTETIARDHNHYVELAVTLANDLPRLTKVRAGLRQQMDSSPLCDGRRFADNLLGLLRQIWQRWCQQSS